MRLPRPHIQLLIRCEVAARQLRGLGVDPGLTMGVSPSKLLPRLLTDLRRWMKADHLQLDHNPALGLRRYNPRIKDVAARYKPNANEPDALIYRDAHAHHIKTNVRGDGAQRSDTAQMKRERRRKRKKQRGRSIRSRGFQPPYRPFPKRVKA